MSHVFMAAEASSSKVDLSFSVGDLFNTVNASLDLNTLTSFDPCGYRQTDITTSASHVLSGDRTAVQNPPDIH